MLGLIFNIQRFSVHDGPGIRTTVFFKGCNMNCLWCHNPEGLSKNIESMFEKSKCIKCGLCKDRLLESDILNCPTKALSLVGRYISENELFNELIKDKDFYGNNGGVTFSGGECLLQVDFILSVIKLLKKENINVVIDTAGNVEWKIFKKVIEHCNLILYDIKTINNKVHKKYTGVSNDLILDNLFRLSKEKVKIIIRIPIIPNINDSMEDIIHIAEFLSKLTNIDKVDLLPYSKMGIEKYEMIGKVLLYNSDKSIEKRKILMYKNEFVKRGIKCQI